MWVSAGGGRHERRPDPLRRPVGFTGHLIEVQADLTPGRPAVVLNGMPDTAVHETRDRTRAAVVNSGLTWPNRRITINLLPAALPKYGSAFDAAIAAAILTGAGELPSGALDGVAVIGELGLDGALRPVRGVLPMVTAALRAGVTTVIVPLANAREAALVPGVTVHAVDSLHRLVEFVRGSGSSLGVPPVTAARPIPRLDLADIPGQQRGRYGLEVAAAGGHHLAMLGAPGTGKPNPEN
jgi:magnesium chelatase family protein